MIMDRKDFIGLKDLTAEDILYVLDTAETMKYVFSQKNKKAPHLQGKSIAILFYENKSKTKVSYELAGKYLSANIVDMAISNSLEAKESLLDIGKIVDQMGADFIVIRHPMAGSAQFLAENVSSSVINAGDGLNENPSQSLLDLMTIKSQKGKFEGLKVAFIGDVLNSRVSRSSMWALLKLGAEVTVSGPLTLIPDEIESFGIDVFTDPYEAVKDADVIMSLRMLETENKYKNLLPSFSEYKNLFEIDQDMIKHAKEDVIIMHPGPIKRGIEISSGLIDTGRCFVNDQIANGVAVRMAMLYILSLRGGIML